MPNTPPSQPGSDGTMRGGQREGAGRPQGSTRLNIPKRGNPLMTPEFAAEMRQRAAAKRLARSTSDLSLITEALELHCRQYGITDIARRLGKSPPTITRWLRTHADRIPAIRSQLSEARNSYFTPYLPDASKVLADSLDSKAESQDRRWAADRVFDGVFGKVGYDAPPPATAVQVNITFGSHNPSPQEPIIDVHDVSQPPTAGHGKANDD